MNQPVDIIIFEGAWSFITQTTKQVVLHEKTSGISFDGDRISYASRFLGPSKISQRIRDGGYTCQVITFVHFLNKERISEIIDKFVGPKTIIGISSTMANGRGCEIIAKFMREFIQPKIKPTNKTIIGGITAHIWDRIIQEKYQYKFDYAVASYAENKIVNILDKIKNHGISKRQVPFWDIQTCQHRWHPSAVILPGESLPLECARGCIFECKFCRFPMLGKKKGTYVRDVNHMRDEILYNYDNFGTTNYMLTDDTFNDTPEKVESWADMVASLPFKIQYVTYLRADLIHRFPHTAKLLLDSGLLATHFGIESLTQKAATLVGKAWCAKHARDYIPELTKNIWGGKVNVFISLIAGLPYETPDDWIRTGEWAIKNNLSAYYATLGIEKYKTKYKGVWKEEEPENLSHFDQHAEEYGYKFIKHKGRVMWELNGLTEFDASRHVKPLNDYFDKHCLVTAWQTTELLSLGVEQNKIMTSSRNKIYTDEGIFQQRDTFIDRYFNTLIQSNHAC